MSAKILDGKEAANQIKMEIREKVEALVRSGKSAPCLAVVIVGQDPASLVYVRNKKAACELTGIRSVSYELPEETTESELLLLIEKLNGDKDISGILVQMPLPPASKIDKEKIFSAISYKKDVDCFHPYNVGLLASGNANLLPCTPAGVIELLKRNNVEIEGKNCVVIGRSNIVGKPMAQMLLDENGTVTICHSKTKNLAEITRSADILVAALGKPLFVTADMIKPDSIVVDVGIHKLNPKSKKVCGDVDFAPCAEIAGAMSPVPGGVGAMTIAMLMQNCLEAHLEAHSETHFNN